MADLPLYAQPVNPAVMAYGFEKHQRNPYKWSAYNAKYYAAHKEERCAKQSARYFGKKANHLRESIYKMIDEAQYILTPTSKVIITLPDCSKHPLMQELENELRAKYAADARFSIVIDKKGPWSVAITML